MRLRSDLWISAYLRRCDVAGRVAVLRRRGAAEAGAILVKVDRLDGTADLYGPAPPSLATAMPDGIDRLFAAMMRQADAPDIEARLVREARFDPDVWIVEVEDGQGRHDLDLAADDSDL